MWIWFVFPLLVILAGCSAKEPGLEKIEGVAQGAVFHISYWTDAPVDSEVLEAEVESLFETMDKTLSNYRPDSTIEIFNASSSLEAQEVGTEIVGLVRVAQNVSELSKGCFDLTIKPLFEIWGFQTGSLTIPQPAAIATALQQVGMAKLEVVDDTHLKKKQANIRLDVSGVAQGYTVAKISEILQQDGVFNYMIEIGGELKTNGHRPNGESWQVATEKPIPGERRVNKIITMPRDAPMSVMTSGTYRHFFDANGRRYSHILDARTGKPVTHDLVAVTVLHENPTLADAWSTALLCLGQQDGMHLANSEKINAIFIRQQDSELLETQSDALRIANNLSIR
jgi:thiamine biosynthesis lipoprotein